MNRGSAMRSQAIAVTGGLGFIGSVLVRQLVAETNASVINIDVETYAASHSNVVEATHSPRYTHLRASIADLDAWDHVFATHRPSAIINLAAETHVDRSIASPADFIETNVHGTFTMLERTRRYLDDLPAGLREDFRLIHVSTDEVFGSLGADESPFTEGSPYRPRSPYAASKAASDHLVRSWSHTYGVPAILTNCSNNYGPHQFPEKLIPLMTIRALRGELLPIYGDGSNVRDWLHVDDHARALRAVLAQGRIGETYLIGASSERSNLEVAHLICSAVDRLEPGRSPTAEQITLVPDRPGHDHRYALDATKARSELGWSPQVHFEDGLEATVAWYQRNPQWWQPLLDRSRVSERSRMGR